MRRLVLALLLAATCAGPARSAADAAPADPGPRLRSWYLGVQALVAGRDTWDVFNSAVLPPAGIEQPGGGLGLQFGRRFGGRFLLGAHFTIAEHRISGLPERLYAGEMVVTGTVLFRERRTLQPFVRGGIGGGLAALDHPDDDGSTLSLGAAALVAGGAQLRLGGRVALEAEAAATFTNYLEVHDTGADGETDEEWRVKSSQAGWRAGLAVVFWF